MANTLYLIRGVPSLDRRACARQLARTIFTPDVLPEETARRRAADPVFMAVECSAYRARCVTLTDFAMLAKTPSIAVYGSFSSLEEIAPYITTAAFRGYRFCIVDVDPVPRPLAEFSQPSFCS